MKALQILAAMIDRPTMAIESALAAPRTWWLPATKLGKGKAILVAVLTRAVLMDVRLIPTAISGAMMSSLG